jgi:uncharacterized protein YdhG (YjbR/CyaY superfamily)
MVTFVTSKELNNLFMMNTGKEYKNVDEYIRTRPKNVQGMLKELRKVIKETAPKAEEGISYMMPGYKLRGKSLVYFAASKNHIGFYPTSSGMNTSIKDLAKYQTGKGTLQFPLDKPIPFALVKRVVQFRMKEIMVKEVKKK